MSTATSRVRRVAAAVAVALAAGCSGSQLPQGVVPSDAGPLAANPAVAASVDPAQLEARTSLQLVTASLQNALHEVGQLDNEVTSSVDGLSRVTPAPCQAAANGGASYKAALVAVYKAQGGLKSQLPSLSAKVGADAASEAQLGPAVIGQADQALIATVQAALATAAQRLSAADSAIHAAQARIKASQVGCGRA